MIEYPFSRCQALGIVCHTGPIPVDIRIIPASQSCHISAISEYCMYPEVVFATSDQAAPNRGAVILAAAMGPL